jgi:hypothetical protein
MAPTFADTILAQLGGGKFIAMTGANGFIQGGRTLSFKLPRGARDGINGISITLTPADLYDVEFLKVSGGRSYSRKVVREVTGVYADQLRSVFTSVTGLETSLGTLGKNPPRRRAVALLKPGTTATHTPSGQLATVAWEANGPRGKKGPWYWVSFTAPVAGAELHQTSDGPRYYLTVHGSTLNYGGMVRANPGFDGSKRQTFPVVKVNPTWGLFVHHQDSRYRLAEMIVGTRLYASRAAAEKAAAAMNARGEHGGMVVVREPLDIAQLYGGSVSKNPRKNPPLVIMGNPGRGRGRVLSRETISIRYIHATDGQPYEHKFGRDDVLECLPDGSFRVYNARGKRLWKDFQ